MSEVLQTLADDAGKVLLFAGLATMFVGGSLGVEVVSAIGVALLVGAPIVGGTVGKVLAALAGESAEEPATDPLEELRQRYARGDISEAEFERKVERLLATEDVSVPEGTTLDDLEAPTTADGEPERERVAEQ